VEKKRLGARKRKWGQGRESGGRDRALPKQG